MIYDVVIVGGGFAGLTCADQLLRHGLRTVLIEGRPRLGGRVLSVSIPGAGCRAELGAEFIHGAPKEIMELVTSAAIPIHDVCDEHLFFQASRLRKAEFWKKVGFISARLARRNTDESVSSFLNRARLSASDKALYRAYVEGFHSADLELMGAKALAESENGGSEEELNGSALFRVSNGYSSALISRYWRSREFMKSVRLQTVLKRISSRKSILRLECEGGQKFQAQKLVLTVPIGVLKALPNSEAGISWEMETGDLHENFESVHMGHVQRIVFRFRSRFWEDLSKNPIGFLHAGPEFYFPTWWTLMPVRLPVLVAWQGGPKALELSGVSPRRRVSIAIETLASLTNRSTKFISENLLQFFLHNWTTDPFSLGAYSYVGVNGVPLARKLSRPLDGRIFLAGEGTVTGAARGTVHGAIRSGLRAAAQVLSS